MADFSFVKDQSGNVCGLWVRNPADAKDQTYLITLFLRGGVPGEAIGGYRVVPNNYDNNGGCFVMLGSASAPGE